MAQQSIAPRQPEKVIYQGDDADRLAELTRELDVAERAEAQGSAAARLGDVVSSAAEKKAELEAFVTEAAERAFVIRFQHIGSKRFRDLVLAHPPRKVDGEPDEAGQLRQVDHPDDVAFGVNMETLPTALLVFRDDVVRTIVEPDLDDAGLRKLLEVDLSEGDLGDLFGRVWALNTGASRPPKAVEGWLASRTSPVMSESPAPSA